MTLHADRALAARIEALSASEMRGFAGAACAAWPESDAGCLEVAGGVAIHVADASPLNGAYGLGFASEVTGADVAVIDDFCRSRGATPVVTVCPLADPSLADAFAQAGWTPSGFENVFVRELDADYASDGDVTAAIEVREAAGEEERSEWGLVAATGFSAPLPPLAQQLAIGAMVAEMPGSRLFWAWVDGRVAGTGELHVEDGVAWLSADSTLPQYRGRGVQGALQRHRLAVGARMGCTLAVTEAVPGSGSQRNIERAGFRVAYTRVELSRPVA